jgi:hypothetical protein
VLDKPDGADLFLRKFPRVDETARATPVYAAFHEVNGPAAKLALDFLAREGRQ